MQKKLHIKLSVGCIKSKKGIKSITITNNYKVFMLQTDSDVLAKPKHEKFSLNFVFSTCKMSHKISLIEIKMNIVLGKRI